MPELDRWKKKEHFHVPPAVCFVLGHHYERDAERPRQIKKKKKKKVAVHLELI